MDYFILIIKMEDESTIKFEVNYKKIRFEFTEDNYIELPEIIKIIKKEFHFQDNDNLQIYHIDDNQIVKKQILNNEDLHSCKKKISEYEYFIKLKINIDPESQNNKDLISSKSNNSVIILESRNENDDKNSPAPFPLKSPVFVEKNEKIISLLEEIKNKENNINKVFEEKLKLCESNNLKEIQSLNNKINEMNIKVNLLMTIIFKFLKSKKNFYKKIEEDLANKIKNYFDDYDKNMNSKINEIKNKLNEQNIVYINEQINKLLPKAKNSNDNIVCNISQIELIKNNDNNIIDKNIKINNISQNKINDIVEKKNENQEDNPKNENKNNENLNNDRINKIEVENNSNNNNIDNNLIKESPKKCQKELEDVNDNNNRLYNSEKKFKLRKINTEKKRYNINKKKEQLDRINEDKNEVPNINSIKEEKYDFQYKSKNIINEYHTNKNIYFTRQNNMRTTFNDKNKRIEDDNSNLLNLTTKVEIKKRRPQKIYTSMNKIFFQDYQQKSARFEKIKDFELKELKKEIEKEFNEGKFVLKNYCQDYIEENVLPTFKKSKLNREQFEVLKYNIEKILECCGLPKDFYSNDIYPRNIKNIRVDRQKSIEALRKFRKEFGISEKEFSDEGIIKRLEENGLDINKTFQKLFG